LFLLLLLLPDSRLHSQLRLRACERVVGVDVKVDVFRGACFGLAAQSQDVHGVEQEVVGEQESRDERYGARKHTVRLSL